MQITQQIAGTSFDINDTKFRGKFMLFFVQPPHSFFVIRLDSKVYPKSSHVFFNVAAVLCWRAKNIKAFTANQLEISYSFMQVKETLGCGNARSFLLILRQNFWMTLKLLSK